MNKKHTLLILVSALLFFWMSWQARLVVTRPEEQKNLPSSLPAANSPPLVALTTVALGGFNGLLVDLLWMRLISLQKEGKVFEIVQLADWITKLEPQFTSVWAFHAWNMAYNISILYSNPEHRWLWVSNGIQLLRDSGLKYNPHEPMLYRELGWIYQHKIGQTMDDMHRYYKVRLATEMAELFDGPRPDYTKDDARLRRMRDEYKMLPEIMQAIEHDYGPLDWRLPESHALYWAYRGLHAAAPGKDTSTCNHMIFQCMAAAFRQGRLYMDSKTGAYLTTPRLDLLPGTLKAYQDAIQLQQTDLFKMVYVNFLAEAVFIMHAYGDDQSALTLFNKMLVEAPALRSQMNFEKYIRQCEQLDVSELPAADVVAWIEGFLYQCYSDSSRNRKAKIPELRKKAELLWKQYMNSRETHGHSDLIGLPDFALIDEQAKQRALHDEGVKVSAQPERKNK